MQTRLSRHSLPSHLLAVVAVCASFPVSLQDPTAFESNRCLACSAVSTELSTRLLKEKPRNHLDMRHRLDSEGKRYGKTIDYKFSELRVVELLDGICDAISEYELAGVVADPATDNKVTWQWLHPKSKRPSNFTRIDKPQLKQQQRRLQNYCAQLIDRSEDNLSAALQQGLSSTATLRLTSTRGVQFLIQKVGSAETIRFKKHLL